MCDSSVQPRVFAVKNGDDVMSNGFQVVNAFLNPMKEANDEDGSGFDSPADTAKKNEPKTAEDLK